MKQAILLALALAFAPAVANAQEEPAPPELKVNVVEGEGAINNVGGRVDLEPAVIVTGADDRPVTGATVFFMLPDSGPTAVFPDGTNSLRTVTDSLGRATAAGLRAGMEAGKYQIRVEAAHGNSSASAVINQANAVLKSGGGGSGGGGLGGLSKKTLAIIAAIGAGAAAGIAVAASGGGGGNGGGGVTPPPAATPTTITPGAPSVGAP